MAMVVDSQVEALYAYSYDTDGRTIAFDVGEKFTLLNKANEDWWQVKRNDEKPMYVPAKYVRELNELDEEPNEKCDDKLVLRTSKVLSNISDENQDNDASNYEEVIPVFKDTESNKSDDLCVNAEKPKVLSSGTRSVVKKLQNSGMQPRGSISDRPKSQSLPAGWEICRDEESGRPYYYNAKTSETRWKPPRSSRSNSAFEENVPLGWQVKYSESSEELNYYNDYNDDIWGRSTDDTGKVYYYKVNGTETAWELPEIQPSYRQSFEALDVTHRRLARSPNLDRKSKTRSLLPMRSPSRNLELSFPPPPEPLLPLNHTHHRTESTQSADSLSSGTEESWPPPPEEFSCSTVQIQAQTKEKEGLLNRKKIADSGNKKIKKQSWSSTFVVLFSSNLVFYKDQKSAMPKPSLQLGKPESSCELRGATLEWAPSSLTRKKNSFQICAVSGLQFILQTDNHVVSKEWFNAIAAIIKRLNEEDSSVVGTVQGRLALDENKSNIKDKLLKLITRRPTIEELEKQGILKEQTFGCPIQHLCEREKRTVPKFVSSCIQAIENRGLSFDGLYRVCGNVSLVQRIRINVDQEDPIELGVTPFDDVHALTGSLKLYFRELPEPLIPFDFFSGFVEAIRQNTKTSKMGALRGLVGQLPKVNYETLKVLLAHLNNVMNESESNRMHAQNLAIVWGPNMMRPRYEAANMAMNMVYQNQIVEFLLLEFKEIFK